MTMTAGEWAGAAMTAATITVSAAVGVNTTRRSVTRDGVEVFLSPQLFEIFLLISKAKSGVTPRTLFQSIYGDAIRMADRCAGARQFMFNGGTSIAELRCSGCVSDRPARAFAKVCTNSKFSGGRP